MNANNQKIDINTASLEELTQIPGIGPRMAERIIAARPFENQEDIWRVSGLGQATVERMLPHITLGLEDKPQISEEREQAEEQPLEIVAEDVEEKRQATQFLPEEQIEAEAEGEEEILEEEFSPAEEEPSSFSMETSEEEQEILTPKEPSEKEGKEIKTVTQPELMGAVVAGSLVSFLLSILLTLGVLALLNGGLQFVRPAELLDVRRQLVTLQNKTTLLAQDIDALRVRMDNLEGLSGRISALEDDNAQLSESLDSLSTQVEGFGQQLDQLASQVDEMQSNVNIFQSFLEGLKQLLSEVYP